MLIREAKHQGHMWDDFRLLCIEVLLAAERIVVPTHYYYEEGTHNTVYYGDRIRGCAFSIAIVYMVLGA